LAPLAFLLATEGVDLSIKSNDGKTALDYAKDMGRLEAVRMLEEAMKCGEPQEAENDERAASASGEEAAVASASTQG
jgi:hypothetical protein